MRKIFTVLLFIICISGINAQDKLYNYTEEIKSTPAKISEVTSIIKKEFGEPTSNGIWTTKNPDYGLMIRAKDGVFYIRAWQISKNSDIETKVNTLLSEIKNKL